MGKPRAALEDRFWRYVTYCPNTGCWLWVGSGKRYGYIGLGAGSSGKTMLAHRLSYKIHKNDPGDMHVCHRCDVGFCVNPDHLFLGTHTDNMRDSFSKGRMFRHTGSAHHKTKLTPEMVREIKSSKDLARVLAKKFGLRSLTPIYDIRSGKRWSDIE